MAYANMQAGLDSSTTNLGRTLPSAPCSGTKPRRPVSVVMSNPRPEEDGAEGSGTNVPPFAVQMCASIVSFDYTVGASFTLTFDEIGIDQLDGSRLWLPNVDSIRCVCMIAFLEGVRTFEELLYAIVWVSKEHCPGSRVLHDIVEAREALAIELVQ